MARASTKGRVTVHRRAAVALVSDTGDKLTSRAADNVQARARRLAPFRTGRLREGIIKVKVRGGVNPAYSVVNSTRHGRFQNDGTGPIFARPGGVLAWPANSMNNPFGTGMVFAKRTRGVPAVHFMEKAAASITAADFYLP